MKKRPKKKFKLGIILQIFKTCKEDFLHYMKAYGAKLGLRFLIYHPQGLRNDYRGF